MLELESLAIDGGGRWPETDNAALLRENVEPAEDGRVIPYPREDWIDAASSPAFELAALVLGGAAGGVVRAGCSTGSGRLKIRSRASLYAASRSSRVKSRRSLLRVLVLKLELPSSSTSAEEEADEVPRDARGRILKTGCGGGAAAATEAAGEELPGEAAGEETAEEEVRATDRCGAGEATDGVVSGAGT